ncbi:MAG: flagellar motor switch protein FliN [Candidatus Brocadia carolinensis]|uniref:Flagellar motor switch protein FliN n=1 Tax=Candidatus Brocadia carolinensis TaxID=1004156 RepID=A0A1V4APH8_9BACT|nr:MAG: flagellar motor switch protein FliN [Candidatus Brocadia caroliniensis]
MEQVKELNENSSVGNENQIQSIQFSQLSPSKTTGISDNGKRNLDLVVDIPVPVSVELGHTTMLVKDILSLSQGSIVELDKVAGAPVDLLVRGKLLAQGEVVVVDENFGLKITNICGSEERIRNLG